MKVGVIGSSGLVGRAVIDSSLAQGHRVVALINKDCSDSTCDTTDALKELLKIVLKHPAEVQNRLEIVEGSPFHGPDILKLVKGGSATTDRSNECDVVVVSLADSNNHNNRNIGSATEAMVSLLVAKPKRIIVVTANGCNSPLNVRLQTLLTMPGVYCENFLKNSESKLSKELEQVDTLVQQSKRQPWLLIRPNNMVSDLELVRTMTLSNCTKKYEAVTGSSAGLWRSKISSRDVACFIVDHLEDVSRDNTPVHLFKGKREKRDGEKTCCLWFLHPTKLDENYEKSSFATLITDNVSDNDSE